MFSPTASESRDQAKSSLHPRASATLDAMHPSPTQEACLYCSFEMIKLVCVWRAQPGRAKLLMPRGQGKIGVGPVGRGDGTGHCVLTSAEAV